MIKRKKLTKKRKLNIYRFIKKKRKKKIKNNDLKNDIYSKTLINEDEYISEILQIIRTTKVIRGGKKLTFKILSITGNEQNTIGIGIGKSENFLSAIKKSIKNSCKNLKTFNCKHKNTIRNISIGKRNNTMILIKPKKKVGNKVNNIVNIFCKLLGIKNLTSKHKGPKNVLNTTFATLNAFNKI